MQLFAKLRNGLLAVAILCEIALHIFMLPLFNMVQTFGKDFLSILATNMDLGLQTSFKTLEMREQTCAIARVMRD